MLVTCGRLELFTSNAEFVTQILSRPKDFMQLDIGSWIVSHSLFCLDGSGILLHDPVILWFNAKMTTAIHNFTRVRAYGD